MKTKTNHSSPEENSSGRDKEATKQKILRAVETLLAKDGFRGLGVNAVAREAGVDKVLIYRYFGGLAELIDRYGKEGNFWPSMTELTDGDPESLLTLPVGQRTSRILINMMRAIRKRPLTQEILAWETIENNELTTRLADLREEQSNELFERFGEPLPENIDAHAVVALMVAANIYLILRGRTIREFVGVDLQSEQGWDRLERALIMIIDRTIGTREEVPPNQTE